VLKEAAIKVKELEKKSHLSQEDRTEAYIEEVLEMMPSLKIATQLEEVKLRGQIRALQSDHDVPLQEIWSKLSLPKDPISSAVPEKLVVTMIKKPEVDEQQVELKLKYSSSDLEAERDKEVVILKSWKRSELEEQELEVESTEETGSIKKKPIKRLIPTETVSEFKTVLVKNVPLTDVKNTKLEQTFEIKPYDLEEALYHATKKIEDGKKKRIYPSIKKEAEGFVDEFLSNVPGLKEASSLNELQLSDELKSMKTSPNMPASEIWNKLSLPKHPIETAQAEKLIITRNRDPGSVSETVELNLKVRIPKENLLEDFSYMKLSPLSKNLPKTESVEITPQDLKTVLKEAAIKVKELEKKSHLSQEDRTEAYIEEVLEMMPSLKIATQLEEVKLRGQIRALQSDHDVTLQEIWSTLSLPKDPISSAVPEKLVVTMTEKPEVDDQQVELKLKYSSSDLEAEKDKEVVILKSWKRSELEEQELEVESTEEIGSIKKKPIKRLISTETVSEFKTVLVKNVSLTDVKKY
jgi:DNA-binding phage protein